MKQKKKQQQIITQYPKKTGNWTFDSIWDSQFTSRGFNQVVVKTFIVLPTIDVCSVMENVNYNKK